MPHTKSFKELLGSMEGEYLGKPVPKKYQARYGKVYDPNDVKSFAYAVAKTKHIPIDLKRK